MLHPLAFAGWSGLLVTAVQLLPVGRLDGGYLARALFGRRAASMLDTAALFVLVLLGLTVEGVLLIGALLVYLFAGKEAAEPLDDSGRIQGVRLVLAAGLLVLSLLMTIPVPEELYDWFGLHRPFS